MALVRPLRNKSSSPLIFDSWKSPGDRPLPPPPSSPKGVSFPNAKVCQVLDEIWASRRLSLTQQCDYADHELLVTTALGEMSIRDTPSLSKEAEADAVTTDTIDVSQTSPHSLPPISARLFPSWQLRFFIREGHDKFFYTYPHLQGRPFCSLQEAEDAISRHLDESRSPKMCTDGLSRSEICIRNALYWPDGTRKNSSKSCPKRCNYVALVQSLLDRYNEDHSFSGDRAYKLEDVVSYGEVYERETRSHMFYHINLTTKPRRPDGTERTRPDGSEDGNLYFAEVTCLNGENEEYVLNCFCLVKDNDKGRCYGCEINGSVDLKHPTDAHKYKGGHSSPYPQCCGFDLPREIMDDFCAYDDEEARLAAEESRIRYIYKCLDDQAFLAKLDGARRAAPADFSKREDGHGKGLKYTVATELDGARRAAPSNSSKTKDGQGEGLTKLVVARRVAPADFSKTGNVQGKWLIKYVVPARRIEKYIVPAELDGASRAAPTDSSIKREDGQAKYVVPASQR